jgi:hypothetical protein
MGETMSSLWLNEHRSNLTSQNGEDGVLKAIFARLGSSTFPYEWCVEFGAWDGKYLSNTYALILQGWYAVLAESDPERCAELRTNMCSFPNVFVVEEGVADVDKTLSATRTPFDFDLLSIDIDGQDYEVWENMELYQPRVVVIEVNSSIPPEIKEHGKGRGASLFAMVELGKRKGYELALHTGNAIFVRRDEAQDLNIEPTNWEELMDRSWL